MSEAICLQCGKKKSAPWKTCRHCGYDPSADPDIDALVKSVYLSVGRYDDEAAQAAYRTELDHISLAIQRGERPAFLERDLARLREQRALFKSVSHSAVWNAVMRLFLPSIGFITLLFMAAHFLKALKH